MITSLWSSLYRDVGKNVQSRPAVQSRPVDGMSSVLGLTSSKLIRCYEKDKLSKAKDNYKLNHYSPVE